MFISPYSPSCRSGGHSVREPEADPGDDLDPDPKVPDRVVGQDAAEEADAGVDQRRASPAHEHLQLLHGLERRPRSQVSASRTPSAQRIQQEVPRREP